MNEIVPDLRLAVLKRDGKFCKGCGVEMVFPSRWQYQADKLGIELTYWVRDGKKAGRQAMASIDHIVPRSQGGRLDLDNARLLCQGCNEKRHNLLKTENRGIERMARAKFLTWRKKAKKPLTFKEFAQGAD